MREQMFCNRLDNVIERGNIYSTYMANEGWTMDDYLGAGQPASTAKITATTKDGNKVASCTVVVTNNVTGITIKTAPTKVIYNKGESLNLTGGKITITRQSGEKQDIYITSSMVSGYDSSKTGKQTITVTVFIK